MLFNTFLFFAFLLVVIGLYRILPTLVLQNRWLLISSYVFYGFWDWRFLGLIFASTLVDYLISHRLENAESDNSRRFLVGTSIAFNLGLLGVFKYFNFFASELMAILDLIGLAPGWAVLNIVLPVGISFYTFQTISYTVDVFRRDAKPCDSFMDFALYVSFFPQLVAGPIERSTNLLPQIQNERSNGTQDWEEGTYHVLTGLFKKVVIADNMAPLVNYVFSKPLETLTPVEILLGSYAFAFQIYGDFSGYSSIAKGVAKWMGFDLMWNFRHPYFSISPSEFWRRWHISLSSWLQHYLYIPLGGNRRSSLMTYRNLFITMLLGGLWHGAAWPFVVWGLYQGLLLIGFRIASERVAVREFFTRTSANIFMHAVYVLFFFQLVCYGWLIFRADSLQQIVDMTNVLLLGSYEFEPFFLYGVAMLAILVGPMLIFELWLEKKGDLLHMLKLSKPAQAAIYIYIVFSLLIFAPPEPQVFIYFQF